MRLANHARIIIAFALAALPGCLGSPEQTQFHTQSGITASSQVRLSWNAGGGQQTGFVIQQSSDGVTYATIQQVSASTTSATVTGLYPSSIYYFRIQAINSAGSSSFSKVVKATIPLSN